MEGLQGGLSKEAHSGNGGETGLYYGFVAIVRVYPVAAAFINPALISPAGAGKSILWYATPRCFI
jgi:hypothetical protein